MKAKWNKPFSKEDRTILRELFKQIPCSKHGNCEVKRNPDGRPYIIRNDVPTSFITVFAPGRKSVTILKGSAQHSFEYGIDPTETYY